MIRQPGVRCIRALFFSTCPGAVDNMEPLLNCFNPADPRSVQRKLILAAALILVVLSGCGGLAESEPPAATEAADLQPGDPTPTVFMPVEQTPTPSVVSVFIDPALPPELHDRAMSVETVGGKNVVLSDRSEDAEIMIGLNPERPLTTWIYALAAPFPTVRDSVTLASIHQWWEADCIIPAPGSGSEGADGTGGMEQDGSGDTSQTPEAASFCLDDGLLLSPDVYELMKAWLGSAGEAVQQCTGDCSLVETAWGSPGIYTIIPYDQLEPRWKVLSLENKTPLDYEFTQEEYLLGFEFGLSGSPAYDAEIIQKLGWPDSNYDPQKRTVVVLTGVTALTRATAWRMEAESMGYPAQQIGSWLREADFTHVSNEVSFMEDCGFPDPEQRELRFCSRPEYFDLFLDVDVDLVELTGNHILDFGDEPFLETLELYEGAGMQWFGGGETLAAAREPVLINHHGNQLAFFGCNKAGPISTWAGEDEPGSNPCDDETYQVLSRLDESGYLTFFTYQWYEAYMSRADNSQAYGFQKAVDAGADVVSGSQAHQPQGFQFYNGGFLHFGPGNLFFDQMWSQATREEFVVVYTVYEGRLLSVELKTALLEDYSQPRPMTMLERRDFLERMFDVSRWNTAFEREIPK